MYYKSMYGVAPSPPLELPSPSRFKEMLSVAASSLKSDFRYILPKSPYSMQQMSRFAPVNLGSVELPKLGSVLPFGLTAEQEKLLMLGVGGVLAALLVYLVSKDFKW